MIFRDMTDEQLLKNLQEDILMVARKFALSKGSAYRRAVLKCNKFPLYFPPVEIKSRAQNRWMIYPYAESRKDANRPLGRYLCRQTAWRTEFWYALIWDDERNKFHDMIIVLTHHLIQRFKERMKLDKWGVDLLTEFIHHKPDNYIKNDKDNTFSMRIKGGIVLGVIDGKKWIHKTFIPFDDSSDYKQELMYKLLEDKMCEKMDEYRHKLLNEEMSVEDFYVNLIQMYGEEILKYKKVREKKREERPEKSDKNSYTPESLSQLIPIIKAMEEDTKDGYIPIGMNLLVKNDDNLFIKKEYREDDAKK